MRLAYFVHDLNDPAVARRILMLRAGGLEVVVTGFWRGFEPPNEIAGAKTLPLGRTFDARLMHRGFLTMLQAIASKRLARQLGCVDLFLARNLEMLAIAIATKRNLAPTPAVVYEVLDIHRLLLSRGPTGIGLRTIERALMRDTQLLLTSSPAFLSEYFQPLQFARHAVPALVVENKTLAAESPPCNQQSEIAPGPPWRIGWYGMIRCARSLDILSTLAQRRPDLARIDIRGRPTASVRKRFETAPAPPALSFGGSYLSGDLYALYGAVHFSWVIDYFEEAANSRWLLPNRLYEGGSRNVVPLALRRSETGRWLNALGIGVLLEDPQAELESFLESLAPGDYETMKRAACEAPRSAFVAGQSDCDRLASTLINTVRHRQEDRFRRNVRELA